MSDSYEQARRNGNFQHRTSHTMMMMTMMMMMVGSRNHVLDGGAHGRNLANTIEPSMCVGHSACCQITLTTCLYCLCTSYTISYNKWSK